MQVLILQESQSVRRMMCEVIAEIGEAAAAPLPVAAQSGMRPGRQLPPHLKVVRYPHPATSIRPDRG